MQQKIYMVVMCGAGDRSIAELGGMTPLAAAYTPHADVLAERGVQGMVTVIDGDICPESDSGIMALLGYDPKLYYTGRGSLEAIGLEFMNPGENAVGFRVNFASYDENQRCLDRRTARDLLDEELQALVASVRDNSVLNASLGVHSAIEGFGRHRGVVCLKTSDRPLSANVSNTDPGFKKVGPFGIPNKTFRSIPLPCRPLDETPAAAFTAGLVNRFTEESSKILRKHEVNAARLARGALSANILLFRDAGGEAPDLASFHARFGWSLAIYGQVPAERGLCKLLGGAWRDARQEQNCGDEYYFRDLVNSLLSDPSDVIVVHLKGPDEPGHDGRPIEKTRALERIDQLFTGPLVEGSGTDDVIILTADHATPCDLGIHSADPVPVLISARSIPKDASDRYCENQARNGALPVKIASDLLDYLQRILGNS
ncbi:CMP-5'-phosphonoformate--3-phosphoglycerate phosphonoformyl transferase [Candidatus Nitrospira neomarina]|uniref:CMP-5'-phosphonoformate--3-phosphoglycerate phosphonoformyl transferase n=1 Tax=Candidatus Nitrospira neomarina TaxID=3020899 RepID=A0AA96GMS9_9BACT|nr:CMP-5'-phosphonoformate--3-phosphoglycerate phosphonoformyl transferase [Candidatus Nitrospira neomarina]WNM63140.1 CMP-5'-phosphonoformate--3-phosphoglycerate phosphonoformyl transferase [Candidatus Nitrospira neomarina]